MRIKKKKLQRKGERERKRGVGCGLVGIFNERKSRGKMTRKREKVESVKLRKMGQNF